MSKLHLGSIQDGSKTSGDTTPQKADFVEGCLLRDLGYTDFMHHCVLCEGGSSHLHVQTITSKDSQIKVTSIRH